MADEGKIFLFDMGEPASILAMARQMIRLAGLRPDEDIAIKITGPRRGERLLERLHDDNETVAPTSHPSIWSVNPTTECDPARLFSSLGLVETQCADTNRPEALGALEQLLLTCGVRSELGLDLGADADVTLAPTRRMAPLSANGRVENDARVSPA
jgi:hypothetical protein